ncbi:Fic family protein [Candidatus Gracilibacteria bacterium]|nr:Fic family protein [Candidatus Gracilibacteria bacterium]
MIEIEQPQYKKKEVMEVLAKFFKAEKGQEFFQEIKKEFCLKRYASWKDIKHKQFDGFTAKEVWMGLVFHRNEKIPMAMKDEENTPFFFWDLPRYRKLYHDFDSLCCGQLLSDEPMHKTTFIQNGELEESIYSSKLEGAVTTISDAKRMIRDKIKPKNKDEQMIQNNYETMLKIRTDWKDSPLSLEVLMEIHTSIARNTDIATEKIGRLREDSDKVVVSNTEGEIAHIPPSNKFLVENISNLLAFANDENKEESNYFHPLVKAIALHFWIGYLHPFVDGNGRVARSIFYWYLLKNGYWAIPFLPISGKIIKSPGQYRDSFLLTEQVENDFNYFFEYNIKQISMAMEDFAATIKRVRKENNHLAKLLKRGFNERQAKLLIYFLIKPEGMTTFKIHQSHHQISHLTARIDLQKLESLKILIAKKVGHKYVFFANQEEIQNIFSN